MRKPPITCKNCEQIFKHSFKYCPHCGQKSNEELTISVLFYNTIHNYFSVDARFFKSFIPLLFKPGYLAQKFIEGKRLLYLHPAQLYLFVSVIFFFMFSFIEREQARSLDDSLSKTLNSEKLNEVIAQDSTLVKNIPKNSKSVKYDFSGTKLDSLVKNNAPDSIVFKEMGLKSSDGAFKRRFYAQALKFYKSRKGGSILQTFYDTIPIAMFFLLPIFALILKLLYRKHGRYAHHLVFSFYFFSFLFTAFSIILVINFIYDMPDWFDFLIILSTFMYLFLALKRFYNQGVFKSFFKASLSTFIFLSFVTPLTMAILGIVAFLFY